MFSSLPFSYMFLAVMGVGTLFSISSMHWLGIWAGLELNLIGFLPMLTYQKSTSESESAVKYFVIQALGSGLLILGSLITYSMSFTWDLYDFWGESKLGLVIMIAGLCLKLGLFPFHYWLPSVMAGLPWMSCLLLATWQKLAPLFLIVSLLEMSRSYMLIFVFCFIASGSALIGGLGGINQTQIRALLAYSSISHLGWMAYAALHSEWVMKMYLVIYIIISLSMFMSLWYSDLGTMKNISNMSFFSFMQMSVMILLLSLSGLPPMLGFISKWLVIMAGSQGSLVLILSFLILGSLMSLFYYLSLFFSLLLSTKSGYHKMSSLETSDILVVLIASVNIFGGIMILSTNSLSNML
uniref:NADH-ubiquinone oxidoreductase chain 2 n=1 Tax=Costapex baldwinae TaxID=2782736 RepID=A0A7S6ZP39_9CAEN|nr:NADH dehydrogenase subunit 2 [Costapex baldwinae]